MKPGKLRVHRQLFHFVLWLCGAFGLLGCMGGMPPISETDSTTPTHTEKLQVSKQGLHGAPVRVFQFTQVGNDLPHGVGGNRFYVFLTKPLVARVEVYNRITGQYLEDLPAPPGGFKFPFSVRVPSSGKLVVLDSGGFPGPTEIVIPKVYTYHVSRHPLTNKFKAQLSRTVSFENIPFGFAEDVEVTREGLMIVSDSVLGALWVIRKDGTITPGVTPQTLAPQDAIPALAPCGFPTDVVVGGVPFQLGGNFAPGVGSMASRKGILYFSGTCQGGVSTIPIKSLLDARQPHERASDIQVLTPRPPGVNAETLKGLTFNRFNPKDKRLYAADPFRLQILRIDSKTGQRELLAQDDSLLNFPISQAFLPPLLPGVYTMVVSSDQEHRLASLNVALTEDLFQLPFLLTKVIVR